MILAEGINCNIIQLPDSEIKSDADSFFTDADHFKDYAHDNVQDYIVGKAYRWSQLPKSPENTRRAIEEVSAFIYQMDPSVHDLYIDQVSKMIKPKKAWSDRINDMMKVDTPVTANKKDSDPIPAHVSLVDWEKYGFYEDKNCYYFRTAKGRERGCNFTLVPLFHIESVNNAKRIFRITNEYGITRVIELPQNSLISLGRFKEAIESLGNFLWEMSDTELNKLKRYLYQETKSCFEVTQLGWHKNGFYSWGNGIFNGSFTKVDENGIVSHNEKNYYLPAFSQIWAGELNLYVSERQFVHREGNTITLKDFSSKLIQVFEKNASVALCFYFASLFRDVIIRKFNFFPILNLFGPKGAGKTELAVSIMSFFGKFGKGPNINNTSKAALADHVSQLCNACAHIDEYKNSIDFDKIEFLKGMWDGTGRTRMNMEKDKKKETTAVDCAVILSGQEMPTADIALFSRLVYLTFNKYEYTDEEKISFNELKEIEQLGNTHITNQILSHRKTFIKNFNASYDIVGKDLMQTIGNIVIEDRIFKNWQVILAAFHALKDHIDVAFTYEELITLSASQIQSQNKETKKGNEVSIFWEMVRYLAADGFIHDGIDFKIDNLEELKTDIKDLEWIPGKNILFIQMSRIFQLYRKHGKASGENILPLASIDYYLKNDKRYLGKTRVRFRFLDTTLGPSGEWKTKAEPAYCFYYDDLKISLDENTKDENIGNTKSLNIALKKRNTDEPLPF